MGTTLGLAVLLVGAFLLAGCSEGPTPDGNQSPSPSSATEPPAPATGSNASVPPATDPTPTTNSPTVVLGDCQNFGGVFPVAMGAARAALPEGFEPITTPSDPAGGATLYVLGVRCASSSVDGRATGEATLGYAELAVVPPADRAVPGLGDATVPVFFAATPQPLGEAFARLRLGQVGFGEVGWAEHTGQGDAVVSASLGGASFTLRGAATPTPPAGIGSGEFVLYGVQDGAVQATVIGSSAGGGEAVDVVVTLESSGIPVLTESRPVVRGFSVSGFSLVFRLA
ncbi:MAG: hypothetical protein ACYC2H_03500 [Thermoplasmatota archaeon]